jgi:adenylate cyclase
MKERIKDTFGKYMDPRIVAELVESPELTQLGGDRREMTVMFIDLQGYTSISEILPPDDLVRMLNMFLGRMTDAVSDNTGVINDFLGDAVMAYWGPPFTAKDEHASLACKAALEAVENFERFKEDVVKDFGAQAEGLELNMRIGVSSGEMVAGNIGSVASRKYSVIGDPVNLGARLEGANKNYGTRIILSERTRDLAGSAVHVRELDLIRVKGKTEPTRIFELLPQEPAADRFYDGLTAYRAQDWESALREFQSCLTSAPGDPVPTVFLERISLLKAQPPGSNWDGVWEFQTK